MDENPKLVILHRNVTTVSSYCKRKHFHVISSVSHMLRYHFITSFDDRQQAFILIKITEIVILK